ncbi:MAG: AAA family ATPase [Flavobacteriales bacterium]
MELIVTVGNIGTGKTSYVKEHYEGLEDTVIVRPDEWTDLNKDQKQKKLFNEVEKGLKENKRVVIDGPNLTKKVRSTFLFFKRIAEKEGVKGIAEIIDFGPGDNNSLKRRIDNSPSTSSEEWSKEHKDNQELYEKPELSEGYDKIEKL